MLVFKHQKCLIRSLLFRCFFGMSGSAANDTLSNTCTDSKTLIMIRTGLIGQYISKLLMFSLHNLLQDSLAIIKELFVFNIMQDKIQHKLLCISKTTIQIDSSQ